jgi:hypothetical protein
VLTAERARWLQHLADEAYGQDWRVIAAVRSIAVEALSDDVEVLELGPLDRMSLRRALATEMSAPVAAETTGFNTQTNKDYPGNDKQHLQHLLCTNSYFHDRNPLNVICKYR